MPTSFLVWVLLAAFLHCIISAPLQLNSTLDEGLENRTRRDLCMSKRSLNSSEQENPNTGAPQNSTLTGRVKRGCNLVTCQLHELAHTISQMGTKKENAPQHRISPCGFGRRRRHSLRQGNDDPTHEEDSQNLSTPQAQRRDTQQT